MLYSTTANLICIDFCLFSENSTVYCIRHCTMCLWKEILSQQRIRHFKILQSIYFAYNVGIISSCPSFRSLSQKRIMSLAL